MSRRHTVDLCHQSEDAASSRTSLEAATEAAQRINALLIAKGMLKPSQVSSSAHKPKQQVVWHCQLILCDSCLGTYTLKVALHLLHKLSLWIYAPCRHTLFECCGAKENNIFV